jgi:hypothetical protein
MSSRRSPLIMMMQPTYLWNFPDQSMLRPLDRPRLWTIHGQRPVCAPMLIVLEVVGQEPPQMALVQDDHVVQTFTADASDEPVDIGVLPRTSWGDEHVFNPHMPHPLLKRSARNAVPIVQEIGWWGAMEQRTGLRAG